jgi:hypothetical protein
MNLAALTFLAAGSGIGQPATPVAPPPADVRFVAKRTLAIPVKFTQRAQELDKARLFVSRDNGNTYELHHTITPLETGFTLTAKDDGVYWVHMQLQYRNGDLEPKDPSGVPPAEKLVIDTTKPVVSVTTSEMSGDEVVVEWRIDDKHPADATTKVFYKPLKGDDTTWKEAPAGSVRKRTARFKPELAGPLMVQVATADLAGNIGAANREVMTRSVSGSAPAGGMIPAPSLAVSEPKADPSAIVPLPPANVNPDPPTFTAAAPPAVAMSSASPSPTQPPVQPFTPVAAESPKTIAVGAGTPHTPAAPPPAPAAEPVAAQYSRTPRFDLNYALDGGPSGVARIDLYVTRDDGRNWVRWSSHDGRETPLKVALDTRFNKEIEGDYGFALVPVSGAGLSDPAPTAGTAPEMKVRVDTTPPAIKVFQPTADPNHRSALLLLWEATDRNFGREPIAIEYAEQPNGPWKSVSGGGDGVTVAGGAGPREPHRVENTGSYSWQPPPTLATPRVYLRFTAWDLAGHRNEAVTPTPILVDLTKPKARIQGIVQAGGR